MRKPFRVSVTSVVSALALATLSPTAPAGPGDADPVGLNPQGLMHVPLYVGHTDKTASVWVHSFWMPSGPQSQVYFNNNMCYWTGYSITDRGQGWWDENYTIDMSPYTTHVGQIVSWRATIIDLSTNISYNTAVVYSHID